MRSFGGNPARLSLVAIAISLALGGFSNAVVHAQVAAASPLSNSNWGASAYDYQNTNNDPQTVINSGNVGSLELRWVYQIPINPFNIPGAPPALGVETQPLVVNGTVYIATPYNDIIALSTVTGGVVWQHQVNMTQFIGDKWWSGAYIISGLSLYGGTLYAMASDTTVYAFNALTGAVEWTIPAVAANIPGNTGTYYGEKAPILVGDNLIVRASTTDYGGRGFVAAYNINTRDLSWIWYAVPPSGGDPNWDTDQCQAPCQGNITPYPGDWGANDLIGGGAAWGLMAVDNKTGVIYFSTGHPSDPYNASLRPGPDLYSDSIVALNTNTGKMVWYYQFTSHDIAEHEGGWSVTLANVTINNVSTQVVIQAAKNNQIYVLNAATGKLVYAPITIGAKPQNNINDGLTSDSTPAANLTASQALFGNGQEICPGPDGGIEMAPAISGNTLYVASQNACGEMTAGSYEYKGVTINGYIYTGDPTAAQNSTFYAINLSTGATIWHDNLPDRYQGSSAVVSGGVVYAVDRAGVLYEFNQQNGKLINSFSLGGVGAAGVSIGRDASAAGNMMVFAPAGGGDEPNPTAGVLFAYWLGPTHQPTGIGLEQPIIIVLGVLVVVLAMYVLLKRRPSTKAPAPSR